MKNRQYELVLFIFFFLASCQHKKIEKKNIEIAKPENPSIPIDDKKLINEIIKKAMVNGDTIAYKELRSYFEIETVGDEFLYNSIRMAYRYNFKDAYYDVYWALAHPRTGETIDELDRNTKDLSLYFLLKSYELGYSKAKYQLDEIYGKGKAIPKSNRYLSQMLKNN